MGTASYVLAGVPGGPAFYSTAHGAGRVQSRHQAARTIHGRDLRTRLERQGVLVRGASWRGLAEEAPGAYKNVDLVAQTSEEAGLARRIARLVPLGVVKG
jgi:tRNA-splicing ligase RtcB